MDSHALYLCLKKIMKPVIMRSGLCLIQIALFTGHFVFSLFWAVFRLLKKRFSKNYLGESL